MSTSSVPLSSSRIQVTQTRLKGPPGAVRPSSAATTAGKVSVHMKVESISCDQWIASSPPVNDEPLKDDEVSNSLSGSLGSDMHFSPPTAVPAQGTAPLQFQGAGAPAASGGGGNVFKNTVEIRTSSSLCDPADAIELDALKRELDFYKLHTQVLLQTKSLLEEKLNSITNDFEDFKEAVNKLDDIAMPIRRKSAASSSTRKSSGGFIAESPDDELRYSLSPPVRTSLSRQESGSKRGSFSAFHSAVENLNYGVTEEFKRSASAVGISSSSSPPLVRFAVAPETSMRPSFGQRRSLDSLAPANADSSRLHHFMRPYNADSLFYRIENNDNLGDTSPISEELCRHFLKGRCRYKRLCKFSHEVAICPYCSIDLPQAKIAASTHLSRCYKAHGKPGANNNNSSESFDDDQDQDQDQEVL